MVDKPAEEKLNPDDRVIVLQDVAMRVDEAQEALSAIRRGEVDALVVTHRGGKQSVVLLHGANATHRVLFETLNEGTLAITASSGHILYANARFSELIGHALDDVFGKQFSTFVAPEDEGKFADLLTKTQSGGHKGELCLLTATGARLPVMLSLRAVVEDGVENTCTIVITDLTPIKQAQAAREASERRYRNIVQTALEGIWQIDAELRITFVNERLEQLLGYSTNEMLGRSLLSLVVPEERQHAEKNFRRIFSGERVQFDTRFMRHDGSRLWVIVVASPLRTEHSELREALGMITDITPRRYAEDALRQRERQLAHAMELAQMGSWEWDFEHDTYNWSDELCRIFGENPDAFEISYARIIDRIHPEDREGYHNALTRTVKEGVLFAHEFRILRGDGAERILLMRGHLVPPNETLPARLVGIARDVTDERALERRLRAAVHEKEVLLKEAHHRVKNNLQVISSLLGLQGRLLTDCAAREILHESESRVQTIALVHESIYQSHDLGSIDLSAYTRRLISVVQSMYGGMGLPQIAVDVEPIRIGIDMAVQCGLIMHELVTNALKHAFRGRRRGHVWVSMLRASSSELVLGVRDDGIGLPAEIDLQTGHTLGLRLVYRLVAQLGGTIDVSRENGTQYAIRFPNPGYCAPAPDTDSRPS